MGVFDTVKFEKKLKREDYPENHYGPPKIISTIFSDGYEGRFIYFNNKSNYAVLEILKNEPDWRFSEGDVLIIKTGFSHNHSFFGLLDNYIRQYLLKEYTKNASFNITFLIELDPL